MPIHIYRNAEFGTFAIKEKNGALTNLYFEAEIPDDEPTDEDTVLITETKKQLDEYFSGKLKEFTLPLAPEGSEFMKKIWNLLCEIPYGTTTSYKQVAVRAGNAKASRAVGSANNRNPLPVFVPCHRVIGSDGRLVGFRGGTDMKRKLLDFERNHL